MTRKHRFSNPGKPASEPARVAADPTPPTTCELCGLPMPPGEEMFKFHGYSGPCPTASATGTDSLTLTILDDGSAPPIDPDVAALMAAEGEDAAADGTLVIGSVIDEAGDLTNIRAVPQEPGRLVAGKPSTVHLEDLLAHYDLGPEHILGWNGAPPEQDLVVVTVGGEKVTWPQDLERDIPRSRLTGETGPQRGRVFPTGYLRRDASKDPKE